MGLTEVVIKGLSAEVKPFLLAEFPTFQFQGDCDEVDNAKDRNETKLRRLTTTWKRSIVADAVIYHPDMVCFTNGNLWISIPSKFATNYVGRLCTRVLRVQVLVLQYQETELPVALVTV